MNNDFLFVCIPNNSGSTFVYKSLCKGDVTYLPAEGQFIKGFSGPVPGDYGYPMSWGHHRSLVEKILSNPDCYDWYKTLESWRKVAQGSGKLFIEKSPPNIARTNMLKEHFPNCKFVFSVRNPYAVAEGIKRAQGKKLTNVQIAQHILTCMELQKFNISNFKENSIFFTYEEMCSDTYATTSKIQRLDKCLSKVDLTSPVNVKFRYEDGAKNFNTSQISNLKEKDLKEFTQLFSNKEELLDFFKYKLIYV